MTKPVYLFFFFIFSFLSCSNPSQNKEASLDSSPDKQRNGNRSKQMFPASSYYKKLNLSLDGEELKDALTDLVSNSHKGKLRYTPDVWRVLREADEDMNSYSNVALIYGYDDDDDSYKNDRTRNKNDRLDGNGNGWNREHVYPRSLGKPNLGHVGPGSDAHHLRASDPKMNSNRSNLPFGYGKGTAHRKNHSWFPGEEWKGDVARMMMYMYIRYGDRCHPSRVGKSDYTFSRDMPDVFLDWNVADPVSDFEFQRNDAIADAQGNRNPFIDNPYLATLIWGGNPAENIWLIPSN